MTSLKTNPSKIIIALALMGLILIISNSCNKKDKSGLVSSLYKKWTLSSIQNNKTTQITDYPDSITKKQTVEFTESQKLWFGGVCNGGSANFMVRNDKIQISDLITTEIYCNNYQWEEYMGTNLVYAYQYSVSEDQLIIYSKGGFTLYFVPAITQ